MPQPISFDGLLFDKGDLEEAEKTFRQFLPLVRIEQRKGNIQTEILADALNNFAYLRRTQGDSREAETLFREALELIPARHSLATTRSTLASVLADQGRFDEALQTARDAADEYVQRNGTDAPGYGFSLTVLGGFLSEKGDFKNADENLKTAEAIFRQTLSPTSLWLGDNLRNQAISLYQQQKYAESTVKAAETLRIYDESFGKHYDHYPTVLIVQGLILTKTGMGKEGEKKLREAVRLRADSLPPDHFWIAIANGALGENLMSQNRLAEAETLLIESYNNLRNSQGEDNPRTQLAKSRLDTFYKNSIRFALRQM